MGVIGNLREDLPGVVAILVLGLGLADLFLDVLPGIPFWAVFAIGFAVVLPLVGILTGAAREPEGAERDAGGSEPDDALDRLKRRYAEGEVGDEEFERRLERLLETEDETAAADYLRRERRTRERDGERERA